MFLYKFLAFLYITLLFVGCESYNNRGDVPPSVIGDIDDNNTGWYNDKLNSLNDDVMLPSDVITLNVTIPTPNDYSCKPWDDLTSSPRPCTLEDIKHDILPEDDYEPLLHVNVSSKNFGLPTDVMNASFKIKGGYTRRAAQKAYSVKLDSKKNLFMKQRKFMLTKSESDPSRLRNKIAFDLFRRIPDISSLKVEFVHLKINGVDYGLYNMPEAIRKEYLINRGWNNGDHLYDAVNFLFRELPELSLDVEDDGSAKALKLLDIEKNGRVDEIGNL